jgi:hypothetical protein
MRLSKHSRFIYILSSIYITEFIIFILIIALITLIEIIYYSPLLSLLMSNTLPDSLHLLPVIILNNKQAIKIKNAIASIKVTLVTLSYYFSSFKTLFKNLLLTLSLCLNYIIKLSLQVAIKFA